MSYEYEQPAEELAHSGFLSLPWTYLATEDGKVLTPDLGHRTAAFCTFLWNVVGDHQPSLFLAQPWLVISLVHNVVTLPSKKKLLLTHECGTELNNHWVDQSRNESTPPNFTFSHQTKQSPSLNPIYSLRLHGPHFHRKCSRGYHMHKDQREIIKWNFFIVRWF